jgi:hypothetical protein
MIANKLAALDISVTTTKSDDSAMIFEVSTKTKRRSRDNQEVLKKFIKVFP